MTLVIRITLSLLAVVIMVTFTADADGQIFRRMRDNIRTNYSPQGPVAPIQVAPIQVAPIQVAPQPQRPGQVIRQPQRQYGQSLTPYSRLKPDQRNSPATAQPNRNLNAANPNANSGQVNVRVVTYYDPRSGRTYQRRFILPPNDSAADRVGSQKIVGSNSPSAVATVPQQRTYDKIPKPLAVNPPQQPTARPTISVVQQPKFYISPVRPDQTPTQIQQPTATTQQLPILSGPQTIAANPTIRINPTVTATPVTVSPVTVTPSYQPPTVQLAPTPSVAIANDTADTGSGIVIDPAVAPATVNSDDIRVGSPVSEDLPSDTFSVLESPDTEVSDLESSNGSEEANSLDFDIEINSADEVEAFFDQ